MRKEEREKDKRSEKQHEKDCSSGFNRFHRNTDPGSGEKMCIRDSRNLNGSSGGRSTGEYCRL